MRIVIAGLIGGVVLFVWSMLAHVVLPIGEMGMKVASNQDVTISTLQAAADKGPGVYMIPGMAPEQWQDDAAMQAFVEKYKAAPSAFVVYDPVGQSVDVEHGAQPGEAVHRRLFHRAAGGLDHGVGRLLVRDARGHGRRDGVDRVVVGQRAVLELVSLPDGFHHRCVAGLRAWGC
jgi:hypothetical protein